MPELEPARYHFLIGFFPLPLMPSPRRQYSLPLSSFREQALAFFSAIRWHQQTRPLSAEEIRALAASGQVEPDYRQSERLGAYEHHARRVAYFLSRPSSEPLRVEADGERLVVADGKHRLAAAWIAGLDSVPCYPDDHVAEALLRQAASLRAP